MKKLIAAALISSMALPAFAGGMAEPMVEPEVIAEDTSSTSAGILVPILLLILIAVAVSNNNLVDPSVRAIPIARPLAAHGNLPIS